MSPVSWETIWFGVILHREAITRRANLGRLCNHYVIYREIGGAVVGIKVEGGNRWQTILGNTRRDKEKLGNPLYCLGSYLMVSE